MDPERWAKHPQNPHLFSGSKKLKNLLVVTGAGFLCTAAAPILVPANDLIQAEFHESNRQVVLLTSCLFVLGQGTGPFIFAPIAELYGRRTAFVWSLFVGAIVSLMCCFPPNLAYLIAFRFINGVCASVGPTLGMATVADMYPPEVRGTRMAVYSFGPLAGPILGSVIGSYLILGPSWRWTLYFVAIISSSMFGLALLWLDETYAPVLQQRLLAKDISIEPISDSIRPDVTRKTSQLRQVQPSAANVFRQTFSRPPRLMMNPICALFAIYFSWLYSLIYLFIVAIPLLFGTSRGESSLFSYRWPSSLIGLAYLGLGAGFFIAALINSLSQDKIYRRLQRSHNGEQAPEWRLVLAQFGAVILPCGLMLWAWLAQAQTNAAGPLVGEAILGAGIMLAFNSVQTFIVDATQPYAAAAIAGATLLRSILGAVLPLVAPIMFERLSWGRGGTILAMVSVPIIPAPLLMLRYGDRLRKRFPIRG